MYNSYILYTYNYYCHSTQESYYHTRIYFLPAKKMIKLCSILKKKRKHTYFSFFKWHVMMDDFLRQCADNNSAEPFIHVRRERIKLFS